MRWPWSNRRLGALEVGSRGNVVMTLVSTDRRSIDGTMVTLVSYLDNAGQEYDRSSDRGVIPLTAEQNRRYGFPEVAIGNLVFKRVFVLKNPRLEVVKTLAMEPKFKVGLVRIEMKGPPPTPRGRTHFKGVTYVFGNPDGKINLVMDDGSVMPVDKVRLDGVIKHMMGVYDSSR